MKQLLDFLPIVVFVIAFWLGDIFIATMAIMVATTVQVGITWLLTKQVDKQLKLTFWVVIVMGAATVLLRDDTFIKWKPTVINALLAAALLGTHWLTDKNPLQRLLGHQLELPPHAWATLTYGWACGFMLAAVLNIVVAYSFSLEFWVGYKLWGGFGLTFVYIILTGVYLARGGWLEEPAEADEVAAEPPADRVR